MEPPSNLGTSAYSSLQSLVLQLCLSSHRVPNSLALVRRAFVLQPDCSLSCIQPDRLALTNSIRRYTISICVHNSEILPLRFPPALSSLLASLSVFLRETLSAPDKVVPQVPAGLLRLSQHWITFSGSVIGPAPQHALAKAGKPHRSDFMV